MRRPSPDPIGAPPSARGKRGFGLRVAQLTLVGAGMLAAPVSAASAAPQPAPAHLLFAIGSQGLSTASGVAVDPSATFFYMNPDAGGTNRIYVFDVTGRLRARIAVSAPDEDWEDIAWGPGPNGAPWLYIADTGNAYFVRKDAGKPLRMDYAIIRMQPPSLPVGKRVELQTAPAEERFAFRFADQRPHNAETLLVDPVTGRIYVVDKAQKRGEVPYLWAAPEHPSTHTVNLFEKVARVGTFAASGGAFSPKGDRMVIRNATTASVWRVVGGDVKGALSHAPTTVTLPPQKQGEGVTFTPDGRSLVVNGEGINTLVWQVPLPSSAGDPLATAMVPDPRETTDHILNRRALILAGGAATALLGLGSQMAVRHRRYGRHTHYGW